MVCRRSPAGPAALSRCVWLRVYLTSPSGAAISERAEVQLWVEDLVRRERSAYQTCFQGPEE
jgi:hypothetical protein